MQTIKTKDITATSPIYGAWIISALVDGYIVLRCYYGFTKREAISEFKREITKCKR